MTDTPRLTPRTEDVLRAEVDRPGPTYFTRNEIRTLLAEPDRLREQQANVLAEARARVAALQTANDGTLIAASRQQILNAITATEA